jgi:hypothetical protein
MGRASGTRLRSREAKTVPLSQYVNKMLLDSAFLSLAEEHLIQPAAQQNVGVYTILTTPIPALYYALNFTIIFPEVSASEGPVFSELRLLLPSSHFLRFRHVVLVGWIEILCTQKNEGFEG